MMSRRNWGGLVIGLVLLYLVLGGNRGLWNLYKLHQDKRNLTQEISRLQSEIREYQVETQAFQKDNGLIEKQAREELDLIQPSEMIYKFSSSNLP